MVVKIRIPTPLQRLTEGKEEVEYVLEDNQTPTIIELVGYLDSKYKGIGERISEGGKPRKFVNFYINGDDIRYKEYEKTRVKDGDEVSIVPALAGGCEKKVVYGSWYELNGGVPEGVIDHSLGPWAEENFAKLFKVL